MITEEQFAQLLAELRTLAPTPQTAMSDAFRGGPSATNPRVAGAIGNPRRVAWLTIENRSSVALGLTPGTLQSDQEAPKVPAISVPALHRMCLPVDPIRDVVWSLKHPAALSTGWTAAQRSIPYTFHSDGSPLLDPLYPVSDVSMTVQPGAITPSGSTIVQAPAATAPKNPDAVIIGCLVSIDAMGTGALADLISIEPCYDLASDGVTATAPWGSMFLFAGTGAQIGATASIELPGATGVQITNHNSGGGQTVAVFVTLFYGVPA